MAENHKYWDQIREWISYSYRSFVEKSRSRWRWLQQLGRWRMEIKSFGKHAQGLTSPVSTPIASFILGSIKHIEIKCIIYHHMPLECQFVC